MLILLAEDERDLAELTIDYLASENIECDYASDGAMAVNLIANNHYEVIVLDVNMPKLDGFKVCQKLKNQGNTTPIIFLTARDNLQDKLKGFALGADDYLSKPFDLEELTARIKVLAKRKVNMPTSFQLDTLSVDFKQCLISRSQRRLSLSKTQWQLLNLLVKHSPNVVDKITIEDEIWPDQQPSKAMLKTLLFRLRKLLDFDGETTLLHTVRGTGVALRVDNNE
ncbi:MAG: two-component system response regulator [Gammaproteobacteria bacterium]|nr:MAG: two-component system response regulator [Gammaproteobacteria bacterium]